METLFVEPKLCRMVARDYQSQDHDKCFELWNAGERGTMTRMATGLGKTFSACLKGNTWINRGDDWPMMVISYEKQLVWQFADEIKDFMGIDPGIEMESERVEGSEKVIVASRASLLPATPPIDEQIAELAKVGITSLGACTLKHCIRFIKYLRKDGDTQEVKDEIERLNAMPEAHGPVWSRLHKFDWRLNWLIVFDEAHKHSYGLKSVRHIVDWFDQNSNCRRNGMTATPKLSNGVSLGDKMFPGIAIDYPLFHATKPCAIRDGWAVPYLQKYISVEGVDFKSLKKIAGDFDEADLERVLGEESQLAQLIEPVLDLVEDRRTLIFSPGIAMANNVAAYINARVQAACAKCGKVKWYAAKLLGDEATCPCGAFITTEDILRSDTARSINGETPPRERKEVYKSHQSGKFQFLSVCGLCREGYNDPGISCVAVFRPISKKASSLAEQMKGRSCRPLRGLVDGLNTREERLEAIANSTKPNALIIDLVGITGLADCASTAQIYADGYEDKVVEKAQKRLENDEETDILKALEQAQVDIEEEREKIRLARELAERRLREEAEKRAKAQAEVKYTTTEVGHGSSNPYDATDGQKKFIRFLGMDTNGVVLSKKQAGRIIGQLKSRMPIKEVARLNGLSAEQWSFNPISDKQGWLLHKNKLHGEGAQTPYEASQLLDACLKLEEWHPKKLADISGARDHEELTAYGQDITLCKRVIPNDVYIDLVCAGKKRREQLG